MIGNSKSELWKYFSHARAFEASPSFNSDKRRIFWKIWQPSFTKKLRNKKWRSHHERAEYKARFWDSMPTPCFTILMDLIFLNFFFRHVVSSFVLLLQKETTAGSTYKPKLKLKNSNQHLRSQYWVTAAPRIFRTNHYAILYFQTPIIQTLLVFVFSHRMIKNVPTDNMSSLDTAQFHILPLISSKAMTDSLFCKFYHPME